MPEQPAQKRERKIRPAPVDKTKLQPWQPKECDPADVGALRAVYRGEAPDYLQRRAMEFIIKTLCGLADPVFIPGEEGRRSTDFALGKRAVALEILSLIETPLNERGEQG